MKRLALVLPLVIAACDSGGGSGSVGGFDDGIAENDPCRTESIDALAGAWDGQVEYTGPRGMCVWEVEAVIDNTSTVACGLPGAVTASLLAAEPMPGESCAEMGSAGDWVTTSDRVPTEVFVLLDVPLESGPIYPNGLAGFASPDIRFTLTGNATLELSGGPEWQGVLVKQ